MLLRTRFYIPPLRENGVIRATLLNRLCSSGGGSLVLVSAPAGYGKTTLVSQWLHLHPHQFAWLTLGQEHHAPAVFWHYLITALQQVQPGTGVMAEQLLRAQAGSDLRPVIVALLNDLDLLSVDNRNAGPITLVLDDFHLLKNSALLGQINLLLDHLPSCIRVVITTREEPELSLPRRRASGQLVQLGIDELRFSEQESLCFFNTTMALRAEPDIATRFCNKTEGWIAGLQLAAISLQRKMDDADSLLSDAGLDKHVADYLLEEVFAGLSQPLQQFLLQTALVKRFCAGLCNTMVQRSDSGDQLALLESAHLFLVPMDNHRTWFRYHDLFRQFLCQRVLHHSSIEIGGCVERAARWLEENGYHADAIELCLEHQCWPAAVYLLIQDAAVAAADGTGDHVAHWLSCLPASIMQAEPELLSLQQRVQQRVQLRTQQGVPAAQMPDAIARHLHVNTTVEPLTNQEKAVLQLIAQGLSNKAIADHLHVSINTLKVHIRNLYGKMGVENRTQVLLRMRGDIPR